MLLARDPPHDDGRIAFVRARMIQATWTSIAGVTGFKNLSGSLCVI
jgi:hypothetical protein